MKLLALFLCLIKFNKTILIAYLSVSALYGNESKKDCVWFPQPEIPTPLNVVHNHHSVIFCLFISLNWRQWNLYERQKYCYIMWGRFLWFVMLILGLWTWFYSWNMLEILGWSKLQCTSQTFRPVFCFVNKDRKLR